MVNFLSLMVSMVSLKIKFQSTMMTISQEKTTSMRKKYPKRKFLPSTISMTRQMMFMMRMKLKHQMNLL